MKSSLVRAALAVLVLLAAPALTVAAPADVVAEVDGATISAAEIDSALDASLRKLERQIYDLRRQRIDAVIDDRVLTREAARRGLSVQAVLDAEVNAKPEPVTDEDVDKFYAANKSRLTGTKNELRERIRTHLQSQRATERRKAFLEVLRSRAQIKVHLMEPPVFRADVGATDAPSLGAADAPITIVEFSDFHCPYCKRVLPTLTELRSRYGDKIRLVFRDFPLDNLHPLARRAAEAARCAKDQNRFWDYHDVLFAKAPAASPEQLKQYAVEIGLDAPKFDHCLSSGAHASAVQKDFEEGARLGVTGTPGFFVNGQFISGAQPIETFVRVIDEELKRAR